MCVVIGCESVLISIDPAAMPIRGIDLEDRQHDGCTRQTIDRRGSDTVGG